MSRAYVCMCTQRALAGSPVALRVRAAAVDCGASTVRLAGDGAAATVVAGAANHSLTTLQLRDRYGNAVDPRRADAACGGRAVADDGQGEGGGGTVELVADVDSPGTLSAPLTVAGRYTLQVCVGVRRQTKAGKSTVNKGNPRARASTTRCRLILMLCCLSPHCGLMCHTIIEMEVRPTPAGYRRCFCLVRRISRCGAARAS
jgi:hypothetical protein